MSGAHMRGAPSPDSSDQSGRNPPRSAYGQPHRQGTPPEVYSMYPYEPQRPATPPGQMLSYAPVSLENQSKCSSCIELGCELYSARRTIRDLNLKLMSKTIELEKKEEERATEALKHEKLEDTVVSLQNRCLHIKNKYTTLKDAYGILDNKYSLLYKENEEIVNAQRQIFIKFAKTSSVAANVIDKDLNSTLDSSDSEESSSKSNQGQRKPAEHFKSRPGTSNADGGWNNQQIRPNRSAGPRPDPPRSSGGYGSSQERSGPPEPRANPESKPNEPQANPESKPNEPQANPVSADQSKNPPGRADGPGAYSDSEVTDVVKEIRADLFQMPEEYALAHCVGSDLIMSSGVAVNFRKKFRQVPELLEQNKNPGQVAVLDISGRRVYYLVTKLASTGKPTWDDFEKSVIEWKRLCVEDKVTKIAIPKIGCGRDQLDWNRVRSLLNKQFSGHNIQIVVCVIDQEAAPERKWSLKLCHNKKPLSQLDPIDCALVFIASTDCFITPSIRRLADKFGFTKDYSTNRPALGGLYHYQNPAMKSNIFGLVVKEKHTDPISFKLVGKCLQALRKAVKRLKLWYIGFEAFDDPKIPFVTRKLWTVVIDTFFTEELEVHFCWPEDIKEKNWEERSSS